MPERRFLRPEKRYAQRRSGHSTAGGRLVGAGAGGTATVVVAGGGRPW
jgi:hypothetical protein